MNTLFFRLAASLGIALGVVMVVVWIFVTTNIEQLAHHFIEQQLENETQNLLTRWQKNTFGKVSFDDRFIESSYLRPYSGLYYQINTDDEQIFSRSLWDLHLYDQNHITGYKKLIHTNGPLKQDLVGLVSGFTKNGKNLTVVVAKDTAVIVKLIKKVNRWFTIIAVTVLMTLIIFNYFILRVGLRPLRQIKLQLHALEKGSIENLDTDVPKELKPFITQINLMIEILYKRTARTRNSLADLAHALKKPLTVLYQLADKPPEENSSLVLKEQTQFMNQVIERILRRARLAPEGHATGPFLLDSHLQQLVKMLRTMHPNIEFKCIVPGEHSGSIPMDYQDGLELVGNLLDNACKWAKSVVAITFAGEDSCIFSISDDGPGVTDNQLQSLTQRGYRLDETVEGQGLGLAICKDIITDYQGDLKLTIDPELGGLKVTISLPIK